MGRLEATFEGSHCSHVMVHLAADDRSCHSDNLQDQMEAGWMKVLHRFDDCLDGEKMVGEFDQRSYEEATAVLAEIFRVVPEI